MGEMRVLVVDDFLVIREVRTEALATDADIEVVGSAADGNPDGCAVEENTSTAEEHGPRSRAGGGDWHVEES